VQNFAKPLKRLLAEAGWVLPRQGKGDHEIWIHPSTGQHLTIVTFMKSRHLAKALLKEAGLAKAF